MSGGGSFIGGAIQDNPYDRAINTWKQFPGEAHGLLDTYLRNGQQGMEEYGGEVGRNISRPWEVEDNIDDHYRQSPGVRRRMQLTTDASQRAAAAEGNLGSPNEHVALLGKLNGLQSQDQEAYKQNAMQTYGQGFSGASDLSHMGNNSALNATQFAFSYLQNLMALQESQDGWNNASSSGAIGSITGGFM